MTNDQLIEFVNDLTPAKRKFLTEYLISEQQKSEQEHYRKSAYKNEYSPDCPHCNSFRIVKHGSFNGKQRYLCRDCHKMFNLDTGGAFAYAKRKDQWNEYINIIMSNITIREAAKKLGVTAHTVFIWRHRILSVFEGLKK